MVWDVSTKIGTYGDVLGTLRANWEHAQYSACKTDFQKKSNEIRSIKYGPGMKYLSNTV